MGVFLPDNRKSNNGRTYQGFRLDHDVWLALLSIFPVHSEKGDVCEIQRFLTCKFVTKERRLKISLIFWLKICDLSVIFVVWRRYIAVIFTYPGLAASFRPLRWIPGRFSPGVWAGTAAPQTRGRAVCPSRSGSALSARNCRPTCPPRYPRFSPASFTQNVIFHAYSRLVQDVVKNTRRLSTVRAWATAMRLEALQVDWVPAGRQWKWWGAQRQGCQRPSGAIWKLGGISSLRETPVSHLMTCMPQGQNYSRNRMVTRDARKKHKKIQTVEASWLLLSSRSVVELSDWVEEREFSFVDKVSSEKVAEGAGEGLSCSLASDVALSASATKVKQI